VQATPMFTRRFMPENLSRTFSAFKPNPLHFIHRA
jgi:hypothetical protein